MTPTQRLRYEAHKRSQGMTTGTYRVLIAYTVGLLLRFTGHWLVEYGNRIDAWAGIEPVKVGGTD